MAEIKYLADSSLATVIDPNAAVTNGTRISGDYNNDTELDLEAIPFLTLQWDSTAPSAGVNVFDLYVLPGDGEGTEVYPTGGVSVRPQSVFLVGTFECRSPSTTVDEVLALPPIRLYPNSNRFVLENVSGQTADAGIIFKIKPQKYQSV